VVVGRIKYFDVRSVFFRDLEQMDLSATHKLGFHPTALSSFASSHSIEIVLLDLGSAPRFGFFNLIGHVDPKLKYSTPHHDGS